MAADREPQSPRNRKEGVRLLEEKLRIFLATDPTAEGLHTFIEGQARGWLEEKLIRLMEAGDLNGRRSLCDYRTTNTKTSGNGQYCGRRSY